MDLDSMLQQSQPVYEQPVADGNSQNHYGNTNNIYNAPVSYTTSPVVVRAVEETEIATKLLEALGFIEMEDRLATIARAHAETCQWLFEKAEYKAWRDPAMRHTHHGFLWIKGKPGTGKSMLMKCAYNKGLQELDGGIVISFFFNARGVPLQKSTVGMYRSLMCQLLDKRPELIDGIPRSKCKRLQQQGWPLELLKDVLREAILSLGQLRLTCYIDALDECQESDAKDIIKFFEELSTSAVTRDVSLFVLLSSRHYPRITVSVCRQLILERQQGHSLDIASYIEAELKIGQSLMAQRIRHEILTKASGVFLWVVLVVHILNEHHSRGLVHELEQRLNDIPEDLDNLFAEILQGGSQEKPYLFPLLQWVAFANRPLRREELYHAVVNGLNSCDDSRECMKLDEASLDDMDSFILDSSRGLAEVTKGLQPNVQFIHESVRTYLLDTGLRALAPELHRNLLAQCNKSLSDQCYTYLGRSALSLLQRRSDGMKEALSDHFLEVTRLQRDTNSTHPFLRYALDGVLAHAGLAHSAGLQQHEFIAAFPRSRWSRLYNLLVHRYEDRLSQNVSSMYIFVIQGEYALAGAAIENPVAKSHWNANVSAELHGSLLGAAVDLGDDRMLDLLVAGGVEVDSSARNGQSCLALAIERSDRNIVRSLLQAGASFDAAGHLRLALEAGSISILHILLSHPAYATQHPDDYDTALRLAIRRYSDGVCDIDVVLVLLDRWRMSTESHRSAVVNLIEIILSQPRNPPERLSTISSMIGILVNRDMTSPCLEPSSEIEGFVMLILDESENCIDPIIATAFQRLCKSESDYLNYDGKRIWLEEVARLSAHRKTSPSRHTARDMRFGMMLVFASIHGWIPIMQALLNRSIDIQCRDEEVDLALELLTTGSYHTTSAVRLALECMVEYCVSHSSGTRFRDNLLLLLKQPSQYWRVDETDLVIVQTILDSDLGISARDFRGIFDFVAKRSPLSNSPTSDHARICANIESTVLDWGFRKTCRDTDFAMELGFATCSSPNDRERFKQYLQLLESSELV